MAEDTLVECKQSKGAIMSEPKFTQGKWRIFDKTKIGNGKDFVADCECMGCYFGRSGVDEANVVLISTALKMYESNERVLEETAIVQTAFTVACAQCKLSKPHCCECEIYKGMHAMFRRRDRVEALQKMAKGEE